MIDQRAETLRRIDQLQTRLRDIERMSEPVERCKQQYVDGKIDELELEEQLEHALKVEQQLEHVFGGTSHA